ncbi:MAG: hypothetical protein ACR2QF_04865 [Geminicoccaceae bacterium]
MTTRKFQQKCLTEIGGNGQFTQWRYRDAGLAFDEVMVPGFFDYWQRHVDNAARIKADDTFLIHCRDGIGQAYVSETGLAPNYTPVLVPMGRVKAIAAPDQQTAKKAA